MLDVKRSKITKPPSTKAKKTKSKDSAKAASALARAPSTTASSKSPRRPSPPPSHTTAQATNMPAQEIALPPVKDLASSDPSLRRKSLTTVLEHLETRPLNAPLTPTQHQQLWRAFYVALYMHDSKSAVSVQNLARTLAGTLRCFWDKDVQALRPGDQQRSEEDVWAWTAGWAEAFWAEMAREWVSVDQWRMNKVLMLVRFFVAEGVALAVEGAQTESVGGWQDFVADVVALPLEVERSLPDGLRMHVLDVWGDELEKIKEGADDDDDESVKKNSDEVGRMMVMAAKESSVFRQGEVNVPKNVRARAKEIVQRFEA